MAQRGGRGRGRRPDLQGQAQRSPLPSTNFSFLIPQKAFSNFPIKPLSQILAGVVVPLLNQIGGLLPQKSNSGYFPFDPGKPFRTWLPTKRFQQICSAGMVPQGPYVGAEKGDLREGQLLQALIGMQRGEVT